MKTKLKIIIPIIVAVAAVIIAAVCIKFNTNENYSLEAVMSTAQKYLTEQKYEPAIAEFEKAIQIDPRNVEAYIGIAQAYELIGDTEKALEWLQKGFDLTGDPALKAEIDRLGGSAEAEVTEQTTEETVESTTTPTEETVESTTTPTEEIAAVETAVSYSNEELTDVLKQLIENPNAEIEQSKLDAIKFVNIIGKDYIYAGNEYYDFGITIHYGSDNSKNFSLEIGGVEYEYSYMACYDLSFVSRLRNVQNLTVRCNQISDISALHNLNSLIVLDLTDNQIGDISALSSLTNLMSLSLGCNQISDISALSNLTNLGYLNIWGNQISDISALSNITDLEILGIWGNQISDISALSNLTNLEYLWLYQNQISDISALSNLTNLEYLDIWCNQISDISALSNLTNLEHLHLYQNQISEEDIDYLRNALPNCSIGF